jgi:putative cardiolipin synthase
MTRTASLAIALWVSIAGGCANLPSQEGRSMTLATADTAGTQLGRTAARGVASHPGKTGIHALARPQDALAVRLLLAGATERTLDAQYYIWQDDEVGNLMFESLWRAAERGVRVRLLLDDLNTGGLEGTLGALDRHPNVEVRLYNPIMQRNVRVAGLIFDFARTNRRMHNKSFIADNQVSVVGGRNIGNAYYGAGGGVGFADLDVLVAGAAVSEVSTAFDVYWNSASAFPAANVISARSAKTDSELTAAFEAKRTDPRSMPYLRAVREAMPIGALVDSEDRWEWIDASVVYDDPAKTIEATTRVQSLLFPELLKRLGRPRSALDLVSPYFVPGPSGTEALALLAREGVRVRVLTNSFAASDVKAVHAGYAKRRHDLLRAGVELYELKPTASRRVRDDEDTFGSSASAALHAKTLAVDRQRIFVGSFNFDPRSALVNTEMGIVMQSPALAERLASFFDAEVRTAAYEVRLSADERSFEWIEHTPSGVMRFATEPGTRWWQRLQVEMLSVMPIESLL